MAQYIDFSLPDGKRERNPKSHANAQVAVASYPLTMPYWPARCFFTLRLKESMEVGRRKDM
jgi:hypothetical protein